MIRRHLFLLPSSVHKLGVGLLLALGLGLLVLSLDVNAMSLGRSRGAALLGRGLDITVLASLEPKDETPDVNCFSAEVFYGETRIGAQNVTINQVRTSPTELALRVRSSSIIDEPFVTVYVRAACGLSVSRRYVLLADSPSEPAAPLAVPPAAAVAPASNTATANAAASGITPAPAATTFSADVAAKRKAREERRAALRANAASTDAASTDAVAAKPQRAEPRTPERKSKASLATAPDKAVAQATTPRLKLDLLDVTGNYEPRLRSSAELLSQPTTDMQARAQAAAMWRAINSSPEDLLRDGERLQAIEAEVRAMSELTKQQSKDLAVLRTELGQSQRTRYANPLVYALAAFSLAALGFGLWMWRRRANANAPWWGNATRYGQEPGPDRADAGVPANARPHAYARNPAVDFAPPPVAAAAAEFSPSPAPSTPSRRANLNSGMAALAAQTSSRRGQTDFSALVATPRPVNAEELFDIQQQADFFMSLGQHEQAIDILQNHISDSVGTSALAYLDLFDIYHKIGQREDFDVLRDEFNRVFNAQVPEFERYGMSSRGLEDYESAIQRIQALWPSSKVLDVIEESIFRMPELDAKPFDLEAYRELMLLYAIAKEVSIDEEGNGESLVDFDLPIDDTSVFDRTMPGITPAALGVVPSGDQALDIDLDIFGDDREVAKAAAKPAGPASGFINFEMIEPIDFSKSKNSKL
jgi:pilus assembly protein FimV